MHAKRKEPKKHGFFIMPIRPGTKKRIREYLKGLDEIGVLDRKERRHVVRSLEAQHWEKIRVVLPKGVRLEDVSSEYKEQKARAKAKIDALLKRMEKAKSSKKRRKIASMIEEIAYFAKPPHRAARGKLLEMALTSNNAKERVQAVRALSSITGPYATKFLLRIIKESIDPAVRNETFRILSQNKSPRNIQTIEKEFLGSPDIEVKIFGFNVLANNPSPMAIEVLGKKIRLVEFRTPKSPIRVTKKTVDRFREVLSREVLEKAEASAKDLVEKFLAEMKQPSRRGSDFYANIMYVGMTAWAIERWINRFGRKTKLSEEFYKELLEKLESNNKQLEQIGEIKYTRWSIAHIKKAINSIKKLL